MEVSGDPKYSGTISLKRLQLINPNITTMTKKLNSTAYELLIAILKPSTTREKLGKKCKVLNTRRILNSRSTRSTDKSIISPGTKYCIMDGMLISTNMPSNRFHPLWQYLFTPNSWSFIIISTKNRMEHAMSNLSNIGHWKLHSCR